MRRRKILVVVAISASLGMIAAAPASAAPTVTVTPNTDLVDAQQVSVSANGFAANASIAVLECTTGATTQDNCDLSTLLFTNADGTGTVSTNYNVFRVIQPASTPTALDCAPSNCVLAVADISDQTQAASTPLSFDASIPPPPTLQITATVDSSGRFDHAGNVTITGTLTCNLPADVSLNAYATQRVGRAIFNAQGFSDMPCDGTVPYTLTMNPYNGIFRGGSVSVEVDFFASSGNRDVFGSVDATVQLHGGK
jgi:hypothetical protein